ncbi:DUF72 domain-containing protein [Dasania marina]|uniref:DUF72 domain-containing protein n=1 Tax=Dasania marina TaxID=471499 RepID=UPI0030DC8C5F
MLTSVQPENTKPCSRPAQPYYLGLPLWSNSAWLGSLYPAGSNSQNYLQHYSTVFNTVEGNTTFYALPSVATVDSWLRQAQPGFKFCFKLPKTITHSGRLKGGRLQHGAELSAFFTRLQPLAEHLGPFMIQLPAEAGAHTVEDIVAFIAGLPQDFQFSIELRSLDFFRKDDLEKRLNQCLIKHQVDRVCFDSRALFSQPASTEAEKEAQRKKPNLPVHAIATANNPIIRFIGTKNSDYNQQYYQTWLPKIAQWCAEGKTPYFFVHTPANQVAPLHAQTLHDQLSHLSGWQPLAKTVQSKNQLAMF